MGSHAYQRFLARVAARQPLLRAPPDASLAPASPSEIAALMPYTHPISGYRSRSFELRRLELRVVESSRGGPPSSSPPPQEPPAAAPAAPTTTAITSGDPAASTSGRDSDSGTSSATCGSHTATHSGPQARGAAQTDQTAAAASTPCSTAAVAISTRHHEHHQNHNHHNHNHHNHRRNETSHPPGQAALAEPPAACMQRASPAAAGQAAPHPLPAQLDPGSPQSHAAFPPHTYMEIRYPFTTLPWLWREYHRPGFPGLDPSLIIEDFDTFAADVAARHVGLVPNSMLVTASLERLTWHVHMRPGDGLVPVGAGAGGARIRRLAQLAPTDMRLSGQVTWVGRSTMEVLLQLTAAEAPPPPTTTTAAAAATAAAPPAAGRAAAGRAITQPAAADADATASSATVGLLPGQLVATAEFVMALRDSSLRRAVDVPQLHPQDAQERELFRRGRERNRQRQARRERDAAPAAATAAATAATAAAVQGPTPSSPRPAPAAAAAGSPRPPSSKAAGPAAAAAVAAAATAAAGELGGQGELARALHLSLLRSDFCRTIPIDAEALRVLAPEPVVDGSAAAGHSDRKRRRRDSSDGDRKADADSPPGAVHGGACYDAKKQEGHGDGGADGGGDSAPDGPSAGHLYEAARHDDVICTTVRQTELHRTVVAEFQDRNTSGTVFGGHLLRLAYEHAAAAAAAFAGAPCELLWLEEGGISAPARVGDMLHAVARVVWTEPRGRALRVVVRVGRYDVTSPAQHVLALTLAAAFLAPAPAAPVRDAAGGGGGGAAATGLGDVTPATLMEAGEVMAAQRRHAATLAALAQQDAADAAPAEARQ